MDFSSLNPVTSNALNLAARINDVEKVQRLLKKMNPNCIDNRGWTCLHEAAANDSYQSLLLILKHVDIRPLAETHEGHTALYLACRFNSSVKTIKALLNSVPDIANYGSTENVTPLHISCEQGRLEVIQLLLDYGAIIDVQDFDGDTPLHDAAVATQFETVALLLHAGANPEIKNDSNFTAFHLACYKGCLETVTNLFPFVTDVNDITINNDSPLILATQGCNELIVQFLLENGADPHIKNKYGDVALTMALSMALSSSFNVLLKITDLNRLGQNIILTACKPHYFNLEILEILLTYDISPEYFDFYEQFLVTLEEIGEVRPKYLTNAPINSFLNICEYIYHFSLEKFHEFFYLFLMRGVSVNAIDINECPPLVYAHYCIHSESFNEVFRIFKEHGCDVDHCTTVSGMEHKRNIPDAFIASMTSDPSTCLIMLPYSLMCDAEYLLRFASQNAILGRFSLHVQEELLSMIGLNMDVNADNIAYTVLPLKHYCRQKIRSVIRENRTFKSANEFLAFIHTFRIPTILKQYLCYL